MTLLARRLGIKCAAGWITCVMPLLAQAEQQRTCSDAAESAKSSSDQNSGSCDEDKSDVRVMSMVQPLALFSTDSEGNLRRQFKMEADLAVRGQARLGLSLMQSSVQNSLFSVHTEKYDVAALTGQWRPTKMFKLDFNVGAAQLGSTEDVDGEPVQRRIVPTANVLAHLSKTDESAVIDLGFNRSVYDLSPILVANLVVRSEFVVRPAIALPHSWRFRGRSEVGTMTAIGDENTRMDTEMTLARALDKNSELYASFERLHYGKASEVGYYSPDQVQSLEGGWSRDIERRTFTLSLDVALGAGHAKTHGEPFGPWGASVRAQTDFTWKRDAIRQFHLSAEYDYNQFAPALETSTSSAWSMFVVSVYYRWSYPNWNLARTTHSGVLGKTSARK